MIKLIAFVLSLGLIGCSTISYDPKLTLKVDEYEIKQDSLYSHVAYLASDELEGRKIGTHGSRLAQQYIIEQLTSYGIKPFTSSEFLHHFKLYKHQASNIVGLIPSKSASDKYIVLSAHYDHLGQRGGVIYNGADDNASGVSALLEISKLLAKSPLSHNIIVLFTDAEESNLKGANYFFEHHNEMKEKTILNINLDMLAGSKTTRMLHYISYGLPKILKDADYNLYKRRHYNQSIKIKRGFDRAIDLTSISSNRNWKLASDHGAFYLQKIPFIYYGVGEHEMYHTPDDDFKHINSEFFWHATNIIYSQIRLIENTIIK